MYVRGILSLSISPYRRECPAGTALALVLDRSDGALLPPVHLGRQLETLRSHEGGATAAGVVLDEVHAEAVHGGDHLAVEEVAVLVHLHEVAVVALGCAIQ